MIFVNGKCDSQKIIHLVEQHLLSFNLNLEKDIIASTNDSASVMGKYNRFIDPIGQLCYNHAIHLAVVDVLYSKKENNFYENEESSETEDESMEHNIKKIITFKSRLMKIQLMNMIFL